MSKKFMLLAEIVSKYFELCDLEKLMMEKKDLHLFQLLELLRKVKFYYNLPKFTGTQIK
jgi:hypothetical protein